MKNLLHTKRSRLNRKKSLLKRHLPFWKFYLSLAIVAGILGYIMILGTMQFAKQLFSMKVYAPTHKVYAVEKEAGESAKLEHPRDIDAYTGQAVDEFFTDPRQQSEMRMIMHCLLFRESAHGVSKGMGDEGRAGGPLQFWEGTWTGYRKLMIKEGYTDEISDRYNLKEAIRTTVWAIKNDRAKAWGPIYRSLRGETNATCPIPTFYNYDY